MNPLQKLIVKNFMSKMKKAKPPISIGTLSAKTSIDKSYLSKVIRGERRMNIDQLSQIAKFLRIEPAKLLTK